MLRSLFARNRGALDMVGLIQILTTALDGYDGLIVTFSDGTTGAYVAEELLELRPHREREIQTVQMTLPTSSHIKISLVRFGP